MTYFPDTAVTSGRMPAYRLWQFGACTFDERSLRVEVGGEPVAIPRKQLQILRFLLEHAGQVVFKEDLAKVVWAGRYLTESNLTKCVALLRGALRDEERQIIRTAHCFGYILAVPVRCTHPSDAPVGDAPASAWGGMLPQPA